MLQINDIERIAYITNNIQSLQLCNELDDTQGELSAANYEIHKLTKQVERLEQDKMLLTCQLETKPHPDQSDRLAKLEKMISRTVFNLRENGHMTKKQQLNLADFLAQF